MKIPFVDTLSFDKIDLKDISEGDEVIIGYNAHNYDRDGAGIVGKIVETPRNHPEVFEKYDRPMVDIVIEGKDGNRYRWEVDNGYVTGPNEGKGSDIGKMSGFYPIPARDKQKEEKVD